MMRLVRIECLSHSFFQGRHRQVATGSSQPGEVGLGEMLVTIIQVLREWYIFDGNFSMNTHQGGDDLIETATLPGARIHDGMIGLRSFVLKWARLRKE